MSVLLKVALGGATSTIVLLATPTVSAVNANRVLLDQGGPACQLSVPTTNSKVRPRATGMRNEGTSSEFVICQYAATAKFADADIFISTIDGADHLVQCTGVNGNAINPLYSTKSMQTGTAPEVVVPIEWLPQDFASTGTFGLYFFSVTCVLPPGASIMSLGGDYTEDVGA